MLDLLNNEFINSGSPTEASHTTRAPTTVTTTVTTTATTTVTTVYKEPIIMDSGESSMVTEGDYIIDTFDNYLMEPIQEGKSDISEFQHALNSLVAYMGNYTIF